ncbi:MAG: sulfite exporter TauE/SafE family protein [Victivallales bacterium]
MDYLSGDFILQLQQILIIILCALLVGVSKTGVPGVGILCVPLMALVFSAKMSTGLLLPMLAFADVFAVLYYHRHAQWKHVRRLLPWALLGIGVGSLIIRNINDAQLKPVIGFIVLVMLLVNYWRLRRNGDELNVPTHWGFAASLGFAAGVTTCLANAAGPIVVIYLLAMRLPKNAFIGTAAWYSLILNWLKIPLFVWDGRINMASFKLDLIMLPAIAVGALVGIVILKKIPQKYFNLIIQLLALAAAVKLCWSAWYLF